MSRIAGLLHRVGNGYTVEAIIVGIVVVGLHLAHIAKPDAGLSGGDIARQIRAVGIRFTAHKIPADEALGIPLVQQGDIVPEPLLQQGKFHFPVYLVERISDAAPGVGGIAEHPKSRRKIVVLRRDGVGQQESIGRVVGVLECGQHLMPVVIGHRGVQIQSIQPVLTDHRAGGGAQILAEKGGQLHHVAAVGEGVLFILGRAGTVVVIVWGVFQVFRHVHQNIVGYGHLTAAGIVGCRIGNQIWERSGRRPQGQRLRIAHSAGGYKLHMDTSAFLHRLKYGMLIKICESGPDTAGHIKGHGDGQIVSGEGIGNHGAGRFLRCRSLHLCRLCTALLNRAFRCYGNRRSGRIRLRLLTGHRLSAAGT